MIKDNINRISKEDFFKIKEENIMFITNPGRMGDEDGITFVVKKEEQLVKYRVDGWMYRNKNIRQEEYISLDDATKQFPKWIEAWKNCNNKNYKGKYNYLYMGFGNGLYIDNSIYEEYKTYLDKEVEKNLEKYSDEEKEEMKYAAIFNVWEKALMEMEKE